MKIAFYAPMKSPRDPVPSGDRSIARLIERSLKARGHEVILLSEFRARGLFQSPWRFLVGCLAWIKALSLTLQQRPQAFFTYHVYRKVPDVFGSLLSWLTARPYYVFEGMYSTKGRATKAGRLSYWLTRFALSRAQTVFTYKKEDEEGLRRVLPSQRIRFLPPAIDLAMFKPNPERGHNFRQRHHISSQVPLIACTAMLRADRKSAGVKFLIEALSQLRELPFELVIGGGGEALPEIQTLLERQLPGRFVLLGAVKQDQVIEMLQAADIFAFPGLDEGYGMVYLEAQACALPVVAFNNGGIPEAVGQGAGLLSEASDMQAYKENLRTLLTDSDLRQQMSAKALQHAREFHDAERFADQLTQVVNAW